MTCRGCGGRLFDRRTIDTTLEFAGVRFEVGIPATVCRDCDRESLDDDGLSVAEHRSALYLCRRGHRTGAVLRHARKALGWNGQDLAEALGVAPETLSRWENGHLDVPAHAFALVGCLLEDRDRTYRLLSALHEPPVPVTGTVVLGDVMRGA